MDWRQEHDEDGWPTFLYVIPLGGGRVLVEETSWPGGRACRCPPCTAGLWLASPATASSRPPTRLWSGWRSLWTIPDTVRPESSGSVLLRR